MDNNYGSEATFNQAGYAMRRIDEIFSRVDRLSVNLFIWNRELSCWNYDIVFRDLNSVYSTVYPKLTPDEEEDGERYRTLIRDTIRIQPPFQNVCESSFEGETSRSEPNHKNQDTITDLLFMYRNYIEVSMDKHGLANPSKKDPTKSAIEM